MATENKNLSHYDKSKLPDIQHFKFGIVTSQWNEQVTFGLKKGAIDTLKDCGAADSQIICWEVPGSFELIHGCKKMIENQNVDVVIAIGCVIQGETRHFDFVCEGVTQGIAYLNASQNVPVIFCVLTDNNLQQSLDRSGGKHGNKGVEAAVAAIKMVTL